MVFFWKCGKQEKVAKGAADWNVDLCFKTRYVEHKHKELKNWYLFTFYPRNKGKALIDKPQTVHLALLDLSNFSLEEFFKR